MKIKWKPLYFILGAAATAACAVIPGLQPALPYVAGLAGSLIVSYAATDITHLISSNSSNGKSEGK